MEGVEPPKAEFEWHEVKGVYKNCRGIWAAQWTDERGQRHTKYFNPKFYASESVAKLEAYKFKVHIQREIEMKGGVQRRKNLSKPTLRCLSCLSCVCLSCLLSVSPSCLLSVSPPCLCQRLLHQITLDVSVCRLE